MPNYKLYYFNVTGLAEPIRYILHYCDVDFEDIRLNDFEEWKDKYKKEMPMEQVPVLEINGIKYHQHKSICRYIARQFNLCGSSYEESLKIDILIDDIDDIRTEIRKYYKEVNPELKAALKDLMLPKLEFFLNKFESYLVQDVFFVNNKISWVDIYYAGIFELISNILGYDPNENYPNLKKLISNIRNHNRIKAYIQKRPVTIL